MTTTRNRLVWDWAGSNITWTERVGRPCLHLAVDGLGPTGGETVLDVGCGTGVHFPAVQSAVGPTGRIVGVDVRPKGLLRLGYRLIACAPGEDVTVPIRERFDSVTLLDRHARPTSDPSAETAQYLVLVATKRH